MYIFDLHCDTLHKFYQNPLYDISHNGGHISDIGLLQGSYIAECFAIFLPDEIPKNKQYLFFKKQYNRFLDIATGRLKAAKSHRDIISNFKRKKVSAILTVENADFLGGDLKKLKIAERLGVKILGLCWNSENCLAFPNSPIKEIHSLPLKHFGKEVVWALNSSDIIADVSHLNYGGFLDVAAISKKPFIASHSACYSICPHPRNLTDKQIRLIAESGGVVGLNFYSRFLNGTDKTDFDDIIRHFRHLIKIGGEAVAAIGTDFDGMECALPTKTAAEMPILADRLTREFGFLVAEKICFKNALRLFKI